MEDTQGKQLVEVNKSVVPVSADLVPLQDMRKDEQDSPVLQQGLVQQNTLAEDLMQRQGQMDSATMAFDTELNDRAMAEELINSKKTFGDSKEMKAIKKDLVTIEELLKQEKKVKVTEDAPEERLPLTQSDLSKLLDTYMSAIRHCDEYRAKGMPSSQVGKVRYAMVEKNRDRLLREAALLAEASELLLSGRLTANMTKMEDLLYSARIYDLGFAPEEKMGPVREKTSVTTNKVLADAVKMFKPAKPAKMDKKAAKRYVSEIMALRRELKEFPPGKIYATFVSLNGEYIRITQDEHGAITLGSGDSAVVMKEDAGALIDLLDTKIIEEQDRMDPEVVKEVLFDQSVDYVFYKDGYKRGSNNIWKTGYKIKDVGDIQKSYTHLSRYLELRTGKAAVYFSNLSDTALRWVATGLANGMDVNEAMKFVDAAIKEASVEERQVNTTETLELVQSLSQLQGISNAQELVEYHIEKTEADLKGWREDEAAVKDLVADLVFSEDTWVTDETQAKPEERMRRMLLKHVDTLALIFADNYREDQNTPSLVDRLLEKLPLDIMEEDGIEETALVVHEEKQDMKLMIKSMIIQMTRALDAQMDMFAQAPEAQKKALVAQGTLTDNQLKGGINELKRNIPLLKFVLSTALNTKDAAFMEKLAQADSYIEKSVQDGSEAIQSTINKETKTVFGSDDTGGGDDPYAGLLDPKQKGISPQERKKRVKAGEEALSKVISQSMKGQSGQGKFIKIIFSKYFSDASTMDKRNMFASAIKNMAPKKELPPLPVDGNKEELKKAAEERETIRKEEAGEFLGGILKGAGPLFQKILQGLPVQGMPPAMAQALDDVKSKLAPIPEDVVKAQLLGMVARSKGKVSKITVTRALGAASVGQTFLCKMFGPEFPEEGKDVVVKLLKPDVRNRMMREKKVMLQCARLTDETGGMEATYTGQLSRIEEELDLTIEARNVVEGINAYDTKEGEEYDGVSSMKLNDIIAPTVNSMVLEKAPGETVDRYITELREEIDSLIRQMEPTEEEKNYVPSDAPIEEVKKANRIKAAYTKRVNEIHGKLVEKLNVLMKRQQYMATLAQKWVTEGVYGEGFYHGDLHAGNIMIDDNGATLIDFGNATKLSQKQQVEVTRMVGAAAVGDVDGFREGLHALLKPEFEETYQTQKKRLDQELKKAFSVGDSNCAGQRIAVALLKAQELGLEVPSAIFNFSQCQLRLQNTIDTMNQTIDAICQGMMKTNSCIPQMTNSPYNLYARAQGMRFVNGYVQGVESVVNVPGQQAETVAIKRPVSETFAKSYDELKSQYEELAPADDETVRRFLTKSKNVSGYMKELENLEAGMESVRKIVDDKVAELFKKKKEAKDAAVSGEDLLPTDEVGKVYQSLEKPVGQIGKLTLNIMYRDELRVYIKLLAQKIADGTLKSPEEIKSSEEYKEHLHKFDGMIDRAKGIKSKYDAYAAKLGTKTAPSEEEENELVKLVKDFNAETLPYAKGSPLGTFLSDLSKGGTSGRDLVIQDRVDIEMEALALEDETLGEELTTLYQKIRKDQKEKADPVMIKQEIVELYKIVAAISAKKLEKELEVMKAIRDMGEPLTFIDVMGATISKNFSTSLSRLGFITSVIYQHKLDAEKALAKEE